MGENSFREVLAFSRIHTASLTIPVLVIAALLSGYGYLYVLLFGIFALIFHGVGFALNNIADYEYDMRDPNKKHFALMSGTISIRNATMWDMIGLVVVSAFGMFLIHAIVADVFLFMAISFGIIYNFRNKVSKYAPFYISLSFSLLIPFIMLGHGHTVLMILYTAFAFLTMMYQIGVSGYIKDIEVPQYNLMSRMGMRLVGGQILSSPGVIALASGFRGATWVIGSWAVIVAVHHPSQYVYWGLFMILQVATVMVGFKLIRSQRWIRTVMLKRMSMVEILNYMSIAIGFGVYYGMWWAMFLVVFPIIWFIGFNRLFYGTTMFPRV